MARAQRAKGWAPRDAADAVTLSRFPLAVAIMAVALASHSPSRAILCGLLGVAIATDVVDGWWARRSGTTSEHGARLDSAADATLTSAVAVAVVTTSDFPGSAWIWWAIGAIAAIRFAALWVTASRFHLVSIAHTWSNKAAGLAIAAAALVALASGRVDGWPTAVACVVAGVSALDELIMVATASDYHRDARGAWDRA